MHESESSKHENLLFMLPRIWNVEDCVAGADLGLGHFQFDFDSEDDITKVMKIEPFHFDHWMLSLVRWEPRVDASYPSDIKFWVRVIGVPLNFWAELTFRYIGMALGEVTTVDLDSGMVQMVINGFRPLCFETNVEFHSGEEISVTLRYERLFGFCRRCFSLCHDEKECNFNGVVEDGGNSPPNDPDSGTKLLSYKGALDNRTAKGKEGDKSVQSGKQKGKRPAFKAREEEVPRQTRDARSCQNRETQRYGGEISRNAGEGSCCGGDGSGHSRYQENQPRYGPSQRYAATKSSRLWCLRN